MSPQDQPYHFDPTSPAVMEDPGAAYGELARRAPFHALETAQHRFWITSDYAEIRDAVLSDNPDWSFKWGNAAKDTAHDTGIVTDPPFHNAFRNVLLPGLTPAAMQRLKPEVVRIATALCDSMAKVEGGDFQDLFALPLPAKVMCLMLGLPEEEYRTYKLWADEIQELMFHDARRGSHKAIFAKIYAHCIEMIEARRAMLRAAGIDQPDPSLLGSVVPDDFMSRAVVSTVEGRPLTDMEIVNICVTFLTGGAGDDDQPARQHDLAPFGTARVVGAGASRPVAGDHRDRGKPAVRSARAGPFSHQPPPRRDARPCPARSCQAHVLDRRGQPRRGALSRSRPLQP